MFIHTLAAAVVTWLSLGPVLYRGSPIDARWFVTAIEECAPRNGEPASEFPVLAFNLVSDHCENGGVCEQAIVAVPGELQDMRYFICAPRWQEYGSWVAGLGRYQFHDPLWLHEDWVPCASKVWVEHRANFGRNFGPNVLQMEVYWDLEFARRCNGYSGCDHRIYNDPRPLLAAHDGDLVGGRFGLFPSEVSRETGCKGGGYCESYASPRNHSLNPCPICRIFRPVRGTYLLAQLYIAFLLYGAGFCAVFFAGFYAKRMHQVIALAITGFALVMSFPMFALWCR